MYHESKLNTIQKPDQDIMNWIENDETNVSILAPLQILNGRCLANIMQFYPQEIKNLIDKPIGKNSIKSYIREVFYDASKEKQDDKEK